jgi:hypothetical protein
LTKEKQHLLKAKNKSRTEGATDPMKYKSIKKGELRHWLISGPNYDVNGKVTGSIGYILT